MVSSAAMTEELKQKYENLKTYFKNLGSAVIAFSSGVDSTFMLKAAYEALGKNVIAVTARSHFFPVREKDEAEDFCKKMGIEHIFTDIDEMSIPGVSANPKNRCYLCKHALFEKFLKIAEEHDSACVCEGSNLDDNGDYRPGLKAIAELGIKSPLRECGFWKSEIRIISKELGLETWKKPSYACLASRFVYGESITVEKLTEEFKKIGFNYVSMDLQGFRTGSMNETINKSS